MNKIFACIFIILSLFFILRYTIVGQAVYGDGIFYWAYTRSLYMDGDLNFFNEIGHQYNQESNNALLEGKIENYGAITEKNYAANRYPPGAPLSWLPFFILADGIQRILKFTGIPVSLNGYSDLYQIIVGLGNILFIVIGLYFLYRLLTEFFSSKISLLTTVFLLFATNLFYYGALDVINSHPFSFMIAALYFYLLVTSQNNRSLRQWFLAGSLLGLLAATRTQDIILGIIPLYEIGYQVLKKTLSFRSVCIRLALFGLGSFIGFLPQLVVWITLYGTFWKSPYLGNNSFDFLHPNILGVLFNFKTGMFYFSLLFILSILGLVLYRKKRKILLPLVFLIFAQLYIIASWGGWHQGESYGIRMLISILPVLAIGTGYIVSIISKKINLTVLSILFTLFILYNFAMIGIFQLYIQESTYIYGISTEKLILDKISGWF